LKEEVQETVWRRWRGYTSESTNTDGKVMVHMNKFFEKLNSIISAHQEHSEE